MQAHPQSNTAARIQAKLGPLPSPSERSLAEAGILHDISNLLSALHLYAGLLNRPGVLKSEHLHYAAEIQQIADRSSRLHRQLATKPPNLVSNIRNTSALVGTQKGTEEPTNEPEEKTKNETEGKAAPPDLAATLRDLTPLLTRVAAPATLIVEVPANLPGGTVSAEVLERIILNLVSNAAEAISASRTVLHRVRPGQIRVALNTIENRLRLEVEDNGPGMPPTVAATFLHPPAEPALQRRLGHRIVHELARSSGASLDLRVRPGSGTCFCFQWPLTTLQKPRPVHAIS